jgi:hypothetical protein
MIKKMMMQRICMTKKALKLNIETIIRRMQMRNRNYKMFKRKEGYWTS